MSLGGSSGTWSIAEAWSLLFAEPLAGLVGISLVEGGLFFLYRVAGSSNLSPMVGFTMRSS
jgi:hypothetical protein